MNDEFVGVFSDIKQFVKEWTLPVAISLGSTAYLLFSNVPALETSGLVLGPVCEALLPIAIFCTLFITFSKVDFHNMRIVRWHVIVLCVQLILVGLVVGGILWLRQHNGMMLQVLKAMLTCVIAPCASAAPVVTGKLGGNLTSMTTFTLLSSVITALLIPVVFPMVEPAEAVAPTMTAMLASWWSSFVIILYRLSLVMLLPLLLGAIVRHWVQPLYRRIAASRDLNFYCWCVALSITSGITVKNIVHSNAASLLLVLIAVVSLLTAVAQFVLGRWIGSHTGEHICTGQAMFQKNTGLSIWIAYTYLTPIASIGAGFYVLWQNIINSIELWQMRR